MVRHFAAATFISTGDALPRYVVEEKAFPTDARPGYAVEVFRGDLCLVGGSRRRGSRAADGEGWGEVCAPLQLAERQAYGELWTGALPSREQKAPDGTPLNTACREIHEEIADAGLARDITDRLEPVGSFLVHLPRALLGDYNRGQDYSYLLTLFRSRLPAGYFQDRHQSGIPSTDGPILVLTPEELGSRRLAWGHDLVLHTAMPDLPVALRGHPGVAILPLERDLALPWEQYDRLEEAHA